jgi:L-amino acid N-acyltransferase YncA
VKVRRAASDDAAAIGAIYNQGVEERVATFQPRPLDPSHFAARIAAGELFLVAEDDAEVLGAAWVSAYDPEHDYYAGVGEATLYVERSARRRGTGRALLDALGAAAAREGHHKLVAKVFTSNGASLALFEACGYRRVGVHRRHGVLDGEWKDVVVVERLLGLAADLPG